MAQKQARLDRAAVLRGARHVLNNTGIDGFTTRALAAHLRVQQPALYWHFRTKAHLLGSLAADVLDREHHASLPESGERWDDFLLRNARSFRTALLAVRDGARLHAEFHRQKSDQMPAGSGAPESQIEFLVSEGFAEGSAVRALMAISRYTVGFVLEEQTALDNGCEPVDQDLDFEFGLVAMVEGLASKR